jgi:hypothetical protein
MALIPVLKIDKKKALLKALSFVFPAFSIVFIGYLLIETFLNYSPTMIGISP